jgi:hypothetical protein
LALGEVTKVDFAVPAAGVTTNATENGASVKRRAARTTCPSARDSGGLIQ